MAKQYIIRAKYGGDFEFIKLNDDELTAKKFMEKGMFALVFFSIKSFTNNLSTITNFKKYLF